MSFQGKPSDNFKTLVDKDLPWWVDDATNYVDEYLRKNSGVRVFEYGSGASSIWFARRGANVTSQEANKDFYEMMKAELEQFPNSEIIFVNPSDPTAYINKINELGKFDIIVIDASLRIQCLNNCVDKVNDSGFLFFDNSGWDKFQTGLSDFSSAHPKLVSETFKGTKLFNEGIEQSTVFYKN